MTPARARSSPAISRTGLAHQELARPGLTPQQQARQGLPRPVSAHPGPAHRGLERTLFAVALVAALLVALGSRMPVASYLSPKTGLGYGLGLLGGVLLLLQSLYPLRKWIPVLRFQSGEPVWMTWHILLGVLAPVLILVHCGFSLGSTNSSIALIAMLLVAISGLFGHYLYSRIPRQPAYERLFSLWHKLHVPLFLILIAAGVLHVITVHLY
jgi:hypothetical protein